MSNFDIQPGARVLVRPPMDRRSGRREEPWTGVVRDAMPGTLWVVKDHDPVPALQGRAAYNVHPAWVEVMP